MVLNESDTRSKLIDPALYQRGWTGVLIQTTRETTEPRPLRVFPRGGPVNEDISKRAVRIDRLWSMSARRGQQAIEAEVDPAV